MEKIKTLECQKNNIPTELAAKKSEKGICVT
jgi:hypothetical protein